jgi:hypothetical protein
MFIHIIFICSFVLNLNNMRAFIPFGLAILVLASSCSKKQDPETDPLAVKFRVERAPEWTAIFNRSQGWFGGDGIFAIPYTGTDSESSANDSILFIFSDTMVGEIKDGKLQPGYKMVNNSVMMLKGTEASEANAKFMVNKTAAGEPATIFVPKTPAALKDDYFWLGDGFVNHANSNMYIFAYRIRNTNTQDDFPFQEVGNTLLIIPQGSKFPFEDHRQLDLPFSFQEGSTYNTSFGVGVLDNTAEAKAISPDGFIYVYGVRGSAKELVAARTKPEAVENFAAWEFWNGKDWSANFGESQAITDSVSNELSVTPIGNNKYALIYQYGGILPTIYMQVGPTPAGPFGPRIRVWDTTADIEDTELFSYNAKAHPAISKPGELLVSFNVNSFKFFSVVERIPNLYRPRFVRIVFEKE